ncbi:MAG: N-acetylmuramoyl-L-alanine amidase [Nanoarchaeota archaeon]|nr:N-acetylmuramoyl-L-alanine amidase [Nanoarchaeota archaeon]
MVKIKNFQHAQKSKIFDMKKRGELTLWFIIEIVMAVFVAALLINIATRYGEGDISNEHTIARDLAVQINTLQSVSGNAYIVNTALGKYTIKVKDNKVMAYISEADFTKPYYSYVASVNINNPLFKKPTKLLAGKSGNDIVVDDKKINLDKISCPLVKIEKTDNIAFDPIEAEDIDEDLTLNIAGGVRAYYKNSKLTRNEDIKREIDTEDVENSDIIIGIKLGSYTADKNYAKAYYLIDSLKKEESKKIGCEILNSISDKFEVDGIALIPITKGNNVFDILDKNKPSVFLDIGNMNNKDAFNDITNRKNDLINSIKGGLDQSFR